MSEYEQAAEEFEQEGATELSLYLKMLVTDTIAGAVIGKGGGNISGR